MKNIHLLVTDLFLPGDFAAEVCADLHLPVLEKLLSRGKGETLQVDSLEHRLCRLFSVPGSPVASVSAAFDGLGEGCWMRADPVHARLQREQIVLMPIPEICLTEASQLCDSLNEHFAGQGVVFFAPSPERWYVRLSESPDITTVPLSQALGRNIQGNLPRGEQARRWHQLFNEIQMLLFAHPLNEAREARGALPVNSLWLWGEGDAVPPCSGYASVSSDEILAAMLAAEEKVPYSNWSEQWRGETGDGKHLLVWTGLRDALRRGDFSAWREALQNFENGYARPLWQALRSGKIDCLQLDVLTGDGLHQVSLSRADCWVFWRKTNRLADYSA